MNKASQAIATVKREVQLVEWQRQMQERQDQGITVDEWLQGWASVRAHIIDG